MSNSSGVSLNQHILKVDLSQLWEAVIFRISDIISMVRPRFGSPKYALTSECSLSKSITLTPSHLWHGGLALTGSSVTFMGASGLTTSHSFLYTIKGVYRMWKANWQFSRNVPKRVINTEMLKEFTPKFRNIFLNPFWGSFSQCDSHRPWSQSQGGVCGWHRRSW